MAYRLVVADLDGTTRSRRFGVTPGVRQAIADSRARGVRPWRDRTLFFSLRAYAEVFFAKITVVPVIQPSPR